MEVLAFGNIKDGVLSIANRKAFMSELAQMKNGNVTIKVSRKNQRSLQQNAYLHLLFTIFKNELNQLGNEFTMLEVKDLCKAKYLTVDVVNTNTGECIGQRVKGTHELTKIEMIEFVENIYRWAADMFHIILPLPSTQTSMFNGKDEL